MQRAFGLDVPDTVAEMCRPGAAAVLVYDAQVGILPHVKDREALVGRIREVVDAARAADVPVFYVRHVSLPPTHLGVGALRTAMAWQRKERVDDVTSAFPPDAPHTAIVDELAPAEGEPVFDKLGMSALVGRIREVVDAARAADVPVFYVRHVSLPPTHLGVGALRTAMAWQRTDRADDVTSAFPPDAAHTAVVDELAPVAGEPVFDKLGMSALVGTPLEAALRDRGVTTLVLVGAVLEIGIEPTARHAADLGFLPVVVDDACGIVEPDAAQRSLDSLDYSLMSYRATTAQVVAALSS